MSEDDPAAEDLLEHRLEIETPERVVIVHDLAGIGSRFAAGCIDACILLVPWIGAVCALGMAMPLGSDLKPEEVQAIAMATVGACTAITWLYYLAFETVWSGRTPGKKAMKLRVLSVHGGPASVPSLILRNLVRVADMLPTGIIPVLGGVTMFISPRAQRIGDLAAGTIVVREREEALRVSSSRASGGLPGEELSGDELSEVDRFLARRADMLPGARARTARAIVAGLTARYGLPAGDPERILGLLGARRTPRDLRELAAPKPVTGDVPAPPAGDAQ